MRSILRKISLPLAVMSVTLCASASAEAANAVLRIKTSSFVSKRAIVSKPVAKHVKKLFSKAPAAAKAAPVAEYTYPGVLPFDGYGNYISFNAVANNLSTTGKEDYIFYPKDSVLTYIDASSDSPTSYLWSVPGASPATSTTQDLETVYKQDGRYDFPTLKTTNADGNSTYTAQGTLKIGGKAEIASFNSLSLGTTYFPWYYPWDDESYGFVTGSNKVKDIAFANLFFLGQDSATVESVSVYIRPNPKAAVATNKVKLVLYEPGDDANGTFKLNNKVIATSELKISEMSKGASSVTGIAYTDSLGNIVEEAMGIANFKFSTPVKVGSLFLASVENFGNDLAAGDTLCIMMNDMDPIPVDSFSTVASNISWSYSLNTKGTYSWFPLSDVWSGSLNPVLMICPVVNYTYKTTGFTTASLNETIVTRFKNGFTVSGASEGAKVSVYNLSGQSVMSGKITNQRQNFTGLNNGIYLIKVGNKNSKVAIY